MPLTISVTLDDGDVQRFLDLYNEDAGTEITTDMLFQNEELSEAIAEDMVTYWFDSLSDAESVSPYDLYSEFLNEDNLLELSEDPASGVDDEEEY